MHDFEQFNEISKNTPQSETSAKMDVDPDNPPWNIVSAIGVWILSVLAILLFPLLTLFPYLSSRGIRGSHSEIQEFVLNDPTAVLLQLISVLPAHLLTFAAAWLVVTKGRKYKFFQTLGWRSGGMRWWHYPLILGGFFVVAAVVGSYLPEHETDLIRILKSSRAAMYWVAILSVATAPLVEEVVYRGLLYPAIQRSAGKVLAVAIVTILFTIVHIPQYYQSISTVLLLSLLSLILTVVRASTRNLLPCFIIHLLFNAIQSIMLLANPDLSTSDSITGFIVLPGL